MESKEIDPVSINNYLSYIWCPGDGTPLKNVKKVSPGEYLLVSKGFVIKKNNWYKSPYLRKQKIINDKKFCIKNVRKLLKKAVETQLISDVPVGCFLSGGIDSSSIVALAKEFNPNIRCFTIKTQNKTRNDGFIDDFDFAQKASKYLNVPLDYIDVDEDMLINNIENMIYTMDEPIADPASINVQLISRLARKSGIKVLLSGTGGDDLFTGYRRHNTLSIENLWSFLPFKVRKSITKSSDILKARFPLERRIKKVLSGISLSKEERIINYFRWIKPEMLIKLYSPTFLSSLIESNFNDPLMEYLKNIPQEWTTLDQMLALEQRFFLIDHNLLYTDKMSMREGVEVRVPFLDHDLVEFAAKIPIKYKFREEI